VGFWSLVTPSNADARVLTLNCYLTLLTRSQPKVFAAPRCWEVGWQFAVPHVEPAWHADVAFWLSKFLPASSRTYTQVPHGMCAQELWARGSNQDMFRHLAQDDDFMQRILELARSPPALALCLPLRCVSKCIGRARVFRSDILQNKVSHMLRLTRARIRG
jgi:hypothetical protein